MHEELAVFEHNRLQGEIKRNTHFNTLLQQSKEAQLTSKIALQHLENQLSNVRAQSRRHGFDFGFGRNHQRSSNNANSENLSINGNGGGYKGDIADRKMSDEHKVNEVHPIDSLVAVS